MVNLKIVYLSIYLFISICTAYLLGCYPDQKPSAISPSVESTIAYSPEDSEKRIMPLGDSITQGDAEHNTYRRPLYKTLIHEGHRVDFVGSSTSHHRGTAPQIDFDLDHEGHWGWRIDQILRHITTWMISSNPDFILIHLGSNDLFQGQTAESTRNELSELIDQIRAQNHNISILVAQIIPTDNKVMNDRITKFNALIPPLTQVKSSARSPVMVVDQYTDFNPKTQTYDGVHPNIDGEIQMSERWFDILDKLLS